MIEHGFLSFASEGNRAPSAKLGESCAWPAAASAIYVSRERFSYRSGCTTGPSRAPLRRHLHPWQVRQALSRGPWALSLDFFARAARNLPLPRLGHESPARAPSGVAPLRATGCRI